MRTLFWRFLCATVMSQGLASPLSAANLVTNPSFAGNLDGWLAAAPLTFDAGVDATGVVGSGSARHSFDAGGLSTESALSQCIPTGPGDYYLSGKVLIPTGQALGGSGIILVSFFSGADCSTFLDFDSMSTDTIGSFVTLSKVVTAPPGTGAIWLSPEKQR